MDTEKKVQFVALTKEEIDAMIQQAALAGAQVASDAMMVGQRKSEKEKIDRRLHNTDLLLRNYRTLKASYENAVYSWGSSALQRIGFSTVQLKVSATPF